MASYKYLGIIFSNGGGWAAQVLHMATKMVNKTLQIVAWCRWHGAAIDIALRLWDLYVLRAVAYGASVIQLSISDCSVLDRAHRKCGRFLLNYSKRCPNPVVYASLGWRRISVDIDLERLRLLGRLLTGGSQEVACILDATVRWIVGQLCSGSCQANGGVWSSN